MATVIQNLACFEVTLDAKSGRFYFDEDILNGKKINQIWMYFGSDDTGIRSPFSASNSDTYLNTYSEIIGYSGVFLNIVNTKGLTAIKNLSLSYLRLSSEDNFFKNLDFSEIEINNEIDTQNSFFNAFVPSNQNIFKFLMYVSYNTLPLEISHLNAKGSFSVEIPIPDDKEIFDIRLSDYIPRHYRSNPIKQIIFTERQSRSYLDLKADNKYIENVPNNLLYQRGTTKDVFFDNLKIDYEESFLRYRGSNQSIEDGYEKITFIY